MNKIIYTPPKPASDESYRVILGGRIAWFYREGTLIRTSRGVYCNVHDHEEDSWPWWELAIPQPAETSGAAE